MKARALNSVVREGLVSAGIWWVENALPKHFDPSAVQRYDFEARNAAYLAVKRKMVKVREWESGHRGQWIPAPKPPGPLIWTGKLRESTQRSPSSFAIRATATANKKFVKVPVPLPHPMSEANCSELVRMIQSEADAMGKVAWELITQLFSVYGNQSVEEIIN